MKVISISLSPKEDRELTTLARKTDRSKSQIVRQALRRQYELEQEWKRLTMVGDAIGKKLGFKTDEDVERYFSQTIRSVRHQRLARGTVLKRPSQKDRRATR